MKSKTLLCAAVILALACGGSTDPDPASVRLPLGGAPTFLALRGNIGYVSRPSANMVQVLDLATSTFVDSIFTGSVPCVVVFNNAGTKAYVANQFSHNVGVIDVASRVQASVIPVPGDPLPLVFPPTDSVLFVTTNVNKLYKIRLATNTIVDSLPLPATSHHLLAHPNDTLLYVATRDGGTVIELNWRTMTVARTFTLGGRPQAMVMSPDRSELYVANELSSAIHVITLSTGASASVSMPAGANSIELSPNNTQLYVGLLFAGQIEVLNRATRAHIKTIVTGGVVREMATDVPRNRMVVTNEDGWVDIVP